MVVALFDGQLFLMFYLNEDTGLVVGVGGESLSLLGWDGGVTLDQGSHHTASSLNTERKWGNIQEEKILDLLGFVTAKDGG